MHKCATGDSFDLLRTIGVQVYTLLSCISFIHVVFRANLNSFFSSGKLRLLISKLPMFYHFSEAGVGEMVAAENA